MVHDVHVVVGARNTRIAHRVINVDRDHVAFVGGAAIDQIERVVGPAGDALIRGRDEDGHYQLVNHTAENAPSDSKSS